MKKLLLSSVAAFCLVMPAGIAWAGATAAPAASASASDGMDGWFDPSVDWTGFYAGGAMGYDFGNVTVTDIDGYNGPPPIKYDPDGVNAVVQGGYNWWFDPGWLLGVEAEVGYLGLDGRRQYPPYVGVRLPTDSRASIEGGFLATVTGRFGVTFGHWLVFGKGGFAGAAPTVSYIDKDPAGTTLVSGTHVNDFRSGYTGGGGVEFLFPSGEWSTRIEYDYYDFGHFTQKTKSAGGSTWRFRHAITSNVVKVSVAYHW